MIRAVGTGIVPPVSEVVDSTFPPAAAFESQARM